MGNNKDEDIEKEYAELKFLYAMENEKFRKLFDRWKKEESKFDKLDHEKYVKEKGSSKIYFALLMTMDKLKIPYAFADEPSELGKYDFTPQDAYTRSIYVNTIHFLRCIDKDNSNPNGHPLVDLDKINFNALRYGKKMLTMSTAFFLGEAKAFKKETKQFYSVPDDRNPIKINEVLQKNKYVNLTIDLSQKNKDIEREFKSIINYFKSIIDDLNLLKRETNARRQDIKLYKKYLRVYKLVQEKGQKWTEIAKEVFPEEFKKEDELSESDNDLKPDSALAKVHQYFDKAEKFIREGVP